MTIKQISEDRCACREEEAAIENGVASILEHYRGERSELIPILQQVQGKFGYLPAAAMSKIARFLHMPESRAYGVATFYAQFKLVPTGRNVVRVCRGTACHVKGGSRILKEVEKQLGIKPGESTPDLEYGLETVACIGACALAPTMVVNSDTYGQMKPSRVADILGHREEIEEK